MKTWINRIHPKTVFVGACGAACILLSIGAATLSGNRGNWEYKLVQGTVLGTEPNVVNLGEAVDNHAAQGWELVTASHSKDQWGFALMRREKK